MEEANTLITATSIALAVLTLGLVIASGVYAWIAWLQYPSAFAGASVGLSKAPASALAEGVQRLIDAIDRAKP